MSHFTVLVIGPDVDGQLAKYDENIRVEQYKSRIGTPWWAEKAYEGAGVLENDPHGLMAWHDHEWPDSKGEIGVDDDGLFEWSTYNPDSKWDWYSVGGRWSGLLKLKPEAKGSTGQSGVFDNEPIPGGADIAFAGDVDWEAMIAEDTHTYAVVAEGVWRGSGDMGWFGMSHNDRTDWPDWWNNLVRNLPADTLVTVIDAHI